MEKVRLKKGGTWAQAGIDLIEYEEGQVRTLGDQHAMELVSAGWADLILEGEAEEPEEVEKIDLDFAEQLAEANDKTALDEYAAQFGYNLDRRKSAKKMMEKLKELAS